MTPDKFIGTFIGQLKEAMSVLKDDIASANFGVQNCQYSIGKMQGRIEGLEDALQILEKVYEDTDN